MFGPTTLLLCQVCYVLPSGAYFEVDLSATKIFHMEMEYGDRSVCPSGVRYGPVHHILQNDICKARNSISVVVNIFTGRWSILPVSQDDVPDK